MHRFLLFSLLACTEPWSDHAETQPLAVTFVDPDGWTEAASFALEIAVEPDVTNPRVDDTCDNLRYDLVLISEGAIEDVFLEVGNLGDGEGDTLEDGIDLVAAGPHPLPLETDRFLSVDGRCVASPIVNVQPRDPQAATLRFEVVAATVDLRAGAMPGADAALTVSVRR